MFIRKTYLRKDNAMLVVIEKDNMKTISTMYKKPNCWAEYTKQFPEVKYPTPNANFANLAYVAGLDAVQLQLRSSSFFFKNNNITERDPNYERYQAMIGILAQDMANCLKHDSEE